MIFLVENKLQLETLQKKEFKKSDTFVAFTPDVHVYLEKKGYKTISSSNFFNSNNHFEVSKYSHDFCEIICKFEDENNFFKTQSSSITFKFYLKLYLSHIIMLITIYTKIKEKYPNEEMKYIELEQNKINFSHQPTLNDNDSFYESIIEGKVNSYSSSSQFSFLNPLIKSLNLYKIKKVQEKAAILTSFQNGNMKKYLKFLKDTKGFDSLRFRAVSKNNILEVFYSLYSIVKNIPIITVPSSVDMKYLNKVFNTLKKENNLKYKGFDLFYILEQKIYQLMGHCIFLDNSLETTKEYLDIFNNARILSISSLGFSSILAEASASTNINSTLISHGSHIVHDDLSGIEHYYLSLGQINSPCFKDTVVQSPYAYDFIKDKEKNIYKSKPIMWGNSFENNIEIEENTDNQFVILQASTPKSLIRPIIFETPFEYINNIIQIAKAIEDMKNIKYIVRFRPIDNISLETITYMLRKYKNIEIASDKTFQYYINKADVFISYSSTTIEEAMLENKNVILYGNDGIYEHIQDENKSIHFAKNIQDLKNIITLLNEKKDINEKKHKTYKDLDMYFIS